MKKFITGRWFPLIAAISILASTAGVVLIMIFFGWRFTYAPELETSWDAVSAVAAWAGVITSFIAIWFAIRVPKKIANRQDRISLFEKRYQVYNLFMNLYATMNVLQNASSKLDNKVITQVFDMYFDVRTVCEDREEMYRLRCKEREEIVDLLHSETRKISVLFPVPEEYEGEIHRIISNIYHCTIFPDTQEVCANTIKMFNNLVEKGIFDIMRQELNIF